MAEQATSPGWDVIDTGNGVHVVPTYDGVAHDITTHDCVCGPSFECHDRWLVVHDSLDGREQHE